MKIEHITNGYLNTIAENVKRQCPDLGFALFVFEFNERDKPTRYISNGEREDMIKAIEEVLKRMKQEIKVG